MKASKRRHKSKNPFSMSMEELTAVELSNPNPTVTNLSHYGPVTAEYLRYDFIQDMESSFLHDNKGDSIPSFSSNPKPIPVEFGNANAIMRELVNSNVKAIYEEQRIKENTVSTLEGILRKPTGNTPADLARSDKIQSLMTEINQFASQYGASKELKEQLQKQVLLGHFLDYAKTKRQIENGQTKEEIDKRVVDAGGAPPPLPPALPPAAGAGEGIPDMPIGEINRVVPLIKYLEDNGFQEEFKVLLYNSKINFTRKLNIIPRTRVIKNILGYFEVDPEKTLDTNERFSIFETVIKLKQFVHMRLDGQNPVKMDTRTGGEAAGGSRDIFIG